MTSKERALLRAQANGVDTTLIVGKGGVSEALLAQARQLLEAKELVKGRVLESAMLTAAEAQSAICEATGAEGIQVVGSKFVIWKKSEKVQKEKTAAARQKKPPVRSGKDNPVKAGIRARKQAAERKRQERDKYFHDAAVEAAIARRKQQQGE